MANSPTTTKSTNNPWAPATGNLTDILSSAKTLAGNGTFDPTFSANTTGGLAALGQLGQTPSFTAGAVAPVVQQGAAGQTTGIGALTGFANNANSGANAPGLDATLNDIASRTARGVNSQFSAAGRFGSGAQQDALSRSITAALAPVETQQYNLQQGNAINAAGQLNTGGYTAAGLAPSVDAAKTNQVQTQIAAGQGQDQLEAAKRLAPATALSYESGLTAPIAGLGGTSNSSTVTGSNPLTTGLGLGVSALSLMSDEKTKENIREVGKTHDGQKIYTYNYKGDPRPSMGLLAHQVKRKRPEAVTPGPAGLDMVNYREATRGAARGGVRKPSSMGRLAG